MKKVKIFGIVGVSLFLISAQSFQSAVSTETNLTELEFNNENIKTVKLKITGMTCAGCSNHVSKALNAVDGVKKVDLVYPGDVATIEYDSKLTNEDALIEAIEEVNYKAQVIK